MRPEWINAAAGLVTLVVVATAAYAALQQMRHLRMGNQTAALLALVGEQRDPRFHASSLYVSTQLAVDLENAELRARAADGAPTGPAREALRYLQFFEALGSLVFSNAMDIDVVLRYFAVDDAWQKVEPLVLISRRRQVSSLWEMFEALAMAERQYIAKHGDSWYPKRLPRSGAVDKWLAVDRGNDSARSA